MDVQSRKLSNGTDDRFFRLFLPGQMKLLRQSRFTMKQGSAALTEVPALREVGAGQKMRAFHSKRALQH